MSPEQLARTLVSVGYPREEIAAELHKRFPDADVPALIDDAQSRVDALDRGANREARESEHDLSRSIHRPKE